MSTRPYVVRQGDYLLLLGARFGFDAEKAWQDPKNDDLRKEGRDQNMLSPGDVLYLPQTALSWLQIRAGQDHSFVAGLPRLAVRICLRSAGKPLAGEPYVVYGASISPGQLDDEGFFSADVPTSVREFEIRLTGRHEQYTIKLGHLDPPNTVSGMRERLKALGLLGRAPMPWSREEDEFAVALEQFQKRHSLEVTGAINDATVAKIVEVFGR